MSRARWPTWPQLDVVGPGYMPGLILGVLPDVEHPISVELVCLDQRDTRDSVTGRSPGVHSAAEFANDVVVADFRCLPGNLSGVLTGVAHNDQWPIRWRQPAQPRRETPGRSGIEIAPLTWLWANWSTGRTSISIAPSARAADTADAVISGRTGSLSRMGGPTRLISPSRRKYGGYDPSDPRSAETKPFSSETCSKGFVASSFPMVLVRSEPGGSRAERPGAVRRPDFHLCRQSRQSAQRPVLRMGEFFGALIGDEIGAGCRAPRSATRR